MKKYVSTLLLAAFSLSAIADDFDTSKPFGFCTVSSRTDASSTYNVTGGGCYTYPVPGDFTGTVVVLKAEKNADGTPKDMKSKINTAIQNNKVIIFDGSEGDFIISSTIGLPSSRGTGKTLLGINNARLCTKWYVTPEIKEALDKVNVKSKSSSSGTGGTLSNGEPVDEEREFVTRQTIIDQTGDKSESCRKAGIFSFSSCTNVIIRNIDFVGPGAVDVGGADLISFTGSKHCWVDHCQFTDGTDGNFDITNASDFNTVSWCTFSYTDRSYDHRNTNLIGSSDKETVGTLNTTFAFNWWGTDCNQRMPMARAGKIHMLNNYYTCVGNSVSINPRKNSEFLVEGNYFATGVKNIYSQSGAVAVTWADNNYAASASKPSSFGTTVTVPYSYTVADVNTVPTEVSTKAGNTLYKDASGIESVSAAVNTPKTTVCYNLRGQRVSEDYKGIVIKNGKKYIQK